MASDTRCRTVLLSDVPSKEDQFDGRHEKVADAIHELITTEDGGKTIGLEGPWGSGKSTVVGMLREKFESTNHAVVVYDAYQHEGDPLRLSFLDEVGKSFETKQQIDKDWICIDQWAKKRDELSLRRKESENLTITPLSKFGMVLTLLASAVPIGVAMALAGFSGLINRSENFNERLADQLVFGGLVIVMLPLIWLFIGGGWFALRRQPDKGGVGILGRLLRGGIRHERSISIQTPDPTSIEFAGAFNKLLSDALTNIKRRVLIVIDNLDRMEPDQAKRIWSTLQAFLEFSNQNIEEWKKRLWVLVPYAVSGMEAVWNSDGDDATNFMEKRIQLRFHVPPPILTDSGKYLDYLLNKAFPNHLFDRSVAEKSQVQAVYARWTEQIRSNTDAASTPRHMKQFVNGIGALHRVHRHTYKLGKYAYFHAVTREYDGTDEIVRLLRRPKLPLSELAGVCGLDETQALAMLASLLFSAEEDKAVEMLLRPVIDGALAAGDGDRLNSANQAHGKAFWTTLLSSSMIGFEKLREPGVLLRSAAAINSSELRSTQTEGESFGWCVNKLRDVMLDVREWSNLQQTAPDDFANAVKLFREETIARSFLDGLSRTRTEEVNYAIWLDSVRKILESAKSIDLDIELPEAIVAHGDFPTYLGICDSIVDSGELDTLGKIVVSEIADQEILNQLPEFIRVATADDDARKTLNVLKVLRTRGHRGPSEELLTAVYENLDATRISPARGAADLVSILGMSGEIGQLQPLIEKGVLLSYFNSAFNHGDFDAAAELSLTHFAYHPGGASNSYEGASQEGQNLIGEIGLNPDKYQEFVDACARVVSADDQMGLRQLMRIVSAKPGRAKWMASVVQRLDSSVISADDYQFADMAQDKVQLLAMFPGSSAENAEFRRLIRARLENQSFLSEVLAADLEPDLELHQIFEYVAASLLEGHVDFRESHDSQFLTGRIAETLTFVEKMKNGKIDVTSNVTFLSSLGTGLANIGLDESSMGTSAAIRTVINDLDETLRVFFWSQVRGELLRSEKPQNELFFMEHGIQMAGGLASEGSSELTMDLMFKFAEQLNLGGLRWIGYFAEQFEQFFANPVVNDRLVHLVSTIETAGRASGVSRSAELEDAADATAKLLHSMIRFDKK